jgi:hypothetical protein
MVLSIILAGKRVGEGVQSKRRRSGNGTIKIHIHATSRDKKASGMEKRAHLAGQGDGKIITATHYAPAGCIMRPKHLKHDLCKTTRETANLRQLRSGKD